jgi:UV DNA damage endonuclease
VLELMRIFKLPGYEKFNNIVPYIRTDENVRKMHNSTTSESKGDIPPEQVGMGGREGRVYWPPGMEEYLRPKKREPKAKDGVEKKAKANRVREVVEDVTIRSNLSTNGRPPKVQRKSMARAPAASENEVKQTPTKRRSNGASRVSY